MMESRLTKYSSWTIVCAVQGQFFALALKWEMSSSKLKRKFSFIDLAKANIINWQEQKAGDITSWSKLKQKSFFIRDYAYLNRKFIFYGPVSCM